jgi:hypothetical protein
VLKYKILFRDTEYILLRIANKKSVKIEREFQRAEFESNPSITIIIHNHPQTQIIAVESDRISFVSSFAVIKIIQRCFEKNLQRLNFDIRINPIYEEKEFWNIVNKHEKKIERLVFEFDYPNSPRVNKLLSEELKEVAKSLNSKKTKVEFDAENNQILDNLDDNNSKLNDLVSTSAAGAGPAKLRIKGLRGWLSTGDKVKSIELDEIEIESTGTEIAEFVEKSKSKFFDL